MRWKTVAPHEVGRPPQHSCAVAVWLSPCRTPVNCPTRSLRLRLRALRGCEIGLPHADVAHMLGGCPETVSRWWTAYTSPAWTPCLTSGPGARAGSGRALDDEQAARIQHLIDSTAPEEAGIACPLWSRRAVRDLIAQEFGIPLPVRTVGKYLKRWGYTAKRPRRHAKDRDPEEVRALGQSTG